MAEHYIPTLEELRMWTAIFSDEIRITGPNGELLEVRYVPSKGDEYATLVIEAAP